MSQIKRLFLLINSSILNSRSNIVRTATIIISISCLLLTVYHGRAQDEVDNQLWLDYNYNVQVGEKIFLVGDAGFRGFISNVDWNHIYIRPGARYRFNKTINLTASLATFNTFTKEDYNLSEFRITTDVNVKWPDLRHVDFTYRGRIEKRFFFPEGQSNHDNWRGRLLVSLNIKRFNVFSPKRSVYFQVQLEPFYTFGDESEYEVFIDQARLYIIFGHRISAKFGYNLQYIWQSSRFFADTDLKVSQNIIRIRFYHRINMK